MLKSKLFDSLFYELRPHITWNTFDLRKIFYVLLYAQRIKDGVCLWAVAYKLADLIEVFVDIKGSNVDIPISWLDFAGQAFKSG